VDAELNSPQADAVAHIRGPLLVFAGAGSGKTRVITFRIANLVARERVPPYRILAVTFTNKAAGEMRHRLEGILGAEIARDLWVGTFHATCAKLLRRYGDAVGLEKNFIIYDGADQKAVVTRVLRELDLDEKRFAPRAMLAAIHKEKQEGRGPDEMSLDDYSAEMVKKVYARYEEHLRAANAVDFEDLILRVVKLLEDDTRIEGETIRRRFEFVLVDEFQDTNAVQYRMLRALARDHHNLCVVGDDDQSIYRWRGADVRNIRGFKKDFPETLVVKLEQNYRSTGHIVKAALGVIAPSKEREPKELWTANEDGLPVEMIATKDERDEAAHVVAVIDETRKKGIDPRQIAVFYRIHAQSRVLEEALRAVNMPYQIVGGTKFYERAEIKDALSYLRLAVNPKSDVDLLRVVNVPARGIGATTLDRLTTLATLENMSVWQSLGHLDKAGDIAAAARKRLVAFADMMRDIQAAARTAPATEVLAMILDRSGYRTALEAENTAESDARLENLAELAGSIGDYEAEASAAGEPATLEGFLERVSLQADTDSGDQGGKITLMTVHGAKGLEFDTVLLTGMEEEMFPYRGFDPGGEEEMEEERRLAYVAITRARRRLVMTHTETRQIFGTTRWGRPSRFFGDLPAATMKQGATRAASAGARVAYVDRSSGGGGYGSAYGSRGGGGGGGGREPWRHPQAPAARTEAFDAPPRPARPAVDPGERFVDREFFADDGGADDVSSAGGLRRGSKVVHSRFGEGEVRRVEAAAEPMVVAFFPGWGEKKILARFLKIAS
jgi:DNA helicase-2/ATP-dependent DNA helicase PcrA